MLVLVRVTVPPLVLVGPAEVMDSVSPSASWDMTRSLPLRRTSGWFWVAPALVWGAVGGVLTTCTMLLVIPKKLLSPTYSALTVLEPCGRELVMNAANPPPSKATGPPSGTSLVLNCTFPAGAGPLETELVTVTVKVAFEPAKEGFGEEMKAPAVVASVIVAEAGL